MLNTKLILVEGLPGSGKSMIGQFIGIYLQNNEKSVEWFSEGDEGHPIDLGEIIDKDAFEPVEYMESRIEKWKSFIEDVKYKDKITVLESSMFQHPINALLFSNIADATIIKHISTVLNIIECLNPVLIYFYQEDVRESVKKASKCKGENWTNMACEVITSSLYGQSKNLQGFEGMVEYFTCRRKIEDELINMANINKLLIENTAGNWDNYRKQILNHLQLVRCTDIIKDESNLSPLIGTFYNDEMKCTFEFVVENGMLLDRKTGLEMVFKEEGTFYLPGLPTELVFKKNSSGVIDRMVISGRENMYIFRNGVVFEKIDSEQVNI